MLSNVLAAQQVLIHKQRSRAQQNNPGTMVLLRYTIQQTLLTLFYTDKTGGCSSVVEYSPSMHEAPGPIIPTTYNGVS